MGRATETEMFPPAAPVMLSPFAFVGAVSSAGRRNGAKVGDRCMAAHSPAHFTLANSNKQNVPPRRGTIKKLPMRVSKY